MKFPVLYLCVSIAIFTVHFVLLSVMSLYTPMHGELYCFGDPTRMHEDLEPQTEGTVIQRARIGDARAKIKLKKSRMERLQMPVNGELPCIALPIQSDRTEAFCYKSVHLWEGFARARLRQCRPGE